MARVTEIYPLSFADFWVQDVTPFTFSKTKKTVCIHPSTNNPFWKVPRPEAQYCWRSRWSLTSVTLKFSEGFLQKMKSPKFQKRHTMTRSDLVLKKYVSVHSFGLVQDRIGRCRWCSRGSNLCPMKRPRAWKLASRMLHRFKKRLLTFAYSKKRGKKTGGAFLAFHIRFLQVTRPSLVHFQIPQVIRPHVSSIECHFRKTRLWQESP